MSQAFHSTRLFPKNSGADAYVLTGLAAKCDWVILSDNCLPFCSLRKLITSKPRTIFLSLRNLRAALPFFVNEVLPQLRTPFVLISGSEDVTLPNQVDKRWAPLDAEERALINKVVRTPTLIRWFVENLDEQVSYKMRPLPLGMVYPDSKPGFIEPSKVKSPSDRPLSVLCAHRVRDGAQWQKRKQVSRLAQTAWTSFCNVLNDEVSEQAFIEQLQSNSFVLCVQGGGLDPSPKAWLALYHGCIPIIESSALDEAYQQLPVVIVQQWNEDAISPSQLLKWRDERAEQFIGQKSLSNLYHKLSLDYWWGQITQRILPFADYVDDRSHQ
ncbi:hypothetical protein [Idiomarina sp.]|uniref:hypothetical protein n=1 Tax=Idiomarina sp. TaxID=1874361 RepID=UPI0025B8E2D8|nr:hypothetical protein [Idiomarina sp.]NQZ03484.1 hypothetical protein [Idiomarina sp.]